MITIIRFWSPRDEYGCFSNFYRVKFVDNHGTIWQSSEHYYQAHKYISSDIEYAWLVHQAKTPKEAATLGRSGNLRDDWESVKINVMKRALWYKFNQHEKLRKKLLNTGDATLIESSPYDSYWGEGRDKQGLNMLGQLLMQLRSKFYDSIR